MTKWFEAIRKVQGDYCQSSSAEPTNVRWIGNELGIAGKDTWSKSTVDKEKNTINSNKQGNATVGFEDGTSGPFRKQMLVLLLVGSGEQQRIHQRQWTN